LGFFQLGPGAVISTAIGAASPEDRVPIVAIFGVTAAIGLTILLTGRKRAEASPVTEHPLPTMDSDQDGGSNDLDASEVGRCQVGAG
ncbi:Bcr/CflA family drug resistance efflux transporter, partial [Singulisphaera rosea]